MASNQPQTSETAPILALRSREAARALGISERLLAELVAEKRIPFVKINSALRFPTRELQDWLTDQIVKEVTP